MPEGIVDVIPVDLVVAAIIAVAARARHRPTPARPCPRSSRSRRARRTRCATATSSTSRSTGSRSTRSTTPTASRSSCPSGPSPAGAGCRASSSRAKTALDRAEKVLGNAARCAASRPSSAPPLEEQREEVERALGYVELYGAYAECEAVYGVDRLLALWDAPDARGPGHVHLRPPRRSTGTATSPRSTCRRSSSTPGSGRTPGRPHRPDPRTSGCARQVLVPRPPPRRLRPREHADRVERGGVVLVAGHPPAAPRRPAALRRPDAGRGARRCWPLDRKDRSDFLRHFYRRYEGAPVDQIDEDAAEMFSELILTKSFPAAIRRVREHRAPRPPHGAHHRRARLRHRAAAAAVRRHRLRRARRQQAAATGHLHRRAAPTCRPPARPGPRR